MKVFKKEQAKSGQALGRLAGPNRLTRYAFYALVFAFPWEAVNIGLGENFSLAKVVGILFFGVALLQPKICFCFPPKAFWLFLLYFGLFVLQAIVRDASYDREIVRLGISIAQMLVLFWLTYNLMKDERVVKGFLLAFISACLSLVVAGLFIEGIQDVDISAGNERLIVLGQNPGTTGAILALGIIAVLGLAYGRKDCDNITRLLGWLPFFILIGSLVATGSRGALLSLVIGIAFFLFKGGNVQTKIGLGLVVVVGLGILILLTFHLYPDSLKRIENSLIEGDTAGRDVIYIQAAKMFEEKPLTGWGPVRYRYELSKRTEYKYVQRDPHNLGLKLLLEVGIVGFIPFFLAIGYCLWAAWKARFGLQGSLPLSMLVTLLMINMSHTWDNQKIFWIILAYGLVSARYVSPRRNTNVDSYFGQRSGSSVSKSSHKTDAPIVAGLPS